VTPDAPRTLVGTTLAGRYRIIEKLGEGAMGTVYLAEHIRIGRKDAIKVLNDALAADEESIARFTRGARNVSRILHPNVCTIYDFAEAENGLRYLAMEYVPGSTLKERLEAEGRLPIEQATRIAWHAANALNAAHEAGIVHRDLKPANIMLARAQDGSEIVKVVDFDIAKGPESGEEVTRLGFVVGTPEYMSPEQLAGDTLDGRSDIYSLGLVLFRMIAGALPFRATSPQELMIARLTTEPLRLQEAAPDLNAPAGLQRALDRALARRAIDRQATAADFAREIADAVVPVAPTRVAQSSAPPPPRRDHPLQHRRRLPALYGGAGILLVAILAAVFWPRTPSPGPTPGPPIDSTTRTDTATPLPGNGVGRGTRSDSTTPPNPDPPDPQPRDPLTALSAAQIDELLGRAYDRVDPPPGGTRNIAAAIDTARIVYDSRLAHGEQRANASFILGLAAFESGNLTECLTWMNRTLELRPEHAGAQANLTRCRVE
jgi:serine/threonine-protein kinase